VLQRDLDSNLHLARTWLGQHRESPMFLFFHTFEVHHPYGHRRFTAPGRDERTTEEANYASGIGYTDERLGAFFEWLLATGILADSLVVVMSDHGEGFQWEHGIALHGRTLYDEVLHVPLIMAGPGIPAGKRVASQVSLGDLFATVVDYFGLAAPAGLPSSSLRPLLAAPGPDRDTYLCCMAHPGTRWGWRGGGFKYIATEKPGGLDEELFDLRADPGEKDNLAARFADVAARLRSVTLGRAELNDAAPAVAPSEADAEERAQLRALGYVE
jgi:arylsulfatase A-like enzyme